MVLDALDLFNRWKLGAKPMARVDLIPSLSGGFFDDEQHRFGPNDLLQAPERATKPLGWHVDMWAGDRQENMLTEITKTAGRTLTFSSV